VTTLLPGRWRPRPRDLRPARGAGPGWPAGGCGPVQAVGVGSEMIGAMQAGWDEVVRVELHRKYTLMAEARLGYLAGFGILQ
jgi:hypothetical protein